jgi:hypothetical protein
VSLKIRENFVLVQDSLDGSLRYRISFVEVGDDSKFLPPLGRTNEWKLDTANH